jgi:outer membrane autotransporter protein
MSLVSDNAFDDERAAVVVQEEAPQRATVRVLGYAPEDAAPRGPFGALPAPQAAHAPRLWSVWAAAYGGQTKTNGAGDTGSHDRSSRTVGVAAGVDYRVTPDTKIGFALAGGESRFSLSNGMGASTGDVFQAALYARTNSGPAYVTGVLAYAWHDVTTTRIVTLGGDDTLTASFKAHNVAGQVEAGYRFGWFTPYAALGVQAFTTPTYEERAADGVSVFALDYDGRTATATRSQLGFRAEHTFDLADGMALRLRTRAAWAHDFGATPFVDASFQSVPGAVFRVRGAAPPRDSLLLSAGAELQLTRGFAVSGMFDTQLASGSQSYAGRAQLRYTW